MKKFFKNTIAITLALCCILSAAGAFAPSYATITTEKVGEEYYIYDSVSGYSRFCATAYEAQAVSILLQRGVNPASQGYPSETPAYFPDDDPMAAYISKLLELSLSTTKSATSKVQVKYGSTVFYADTLSKGIGAITYTVSQLRNSNALTMDSFGIALISNITESVSYSDVYNYGSPTIDLAGYTWTAGSAGYCLSVTGSGSTAVYLKSSKTGAKMVGGKGSTASSSGGQGGCIFCNGGKLSVDGITFSNGTDTPFEGGAIALIGSVNGEAAKISNCTFDSCKATSDGGGIHAEINGSAYLTIQKCTFKSCTAQNSSHGGGLYLFNTSANISDCEFNSCSCTTNGGAIRIVCTSNGSSLYLNVGGSTKIVSCVCQYGGAIYSDAAVGKINVNLQGNCLLQNCVAIKGGGVYAAGATTVTIKENASIQNCSATKETWGGGQGGAVYIYTSAVLEMLGNSSIKSCSAENSGSAIFVYNSGKANIKEHAYVSSCNGDAIYTDGGTITINSDGEFPVNLAKSSGTIAVYNGWFNKKVAYPASGKHATGAIPGDAHKNAPYTVADKIVSAIFYTNDGTNASTTYADMPVGNFTIPSCSVTKTGYTFDGWSMGSPSGELIQPGTNLYLQNTTMFFGNWTPGSDAERTLTIKDPVSGDQYTIKEKSRTIKVESYSSKFKRSNYYILSYNTKADGSGTTIPIGGTVDFGKTVSATIYVVWKESLNISEGTVNVLTFKDSYFNSKNKDFTFQSENSSIILMDNGFVRTGEVLAGWSTLPNGNGTVYQLGDRYSFTSNNATLYAYWVSKTLNTYHAGESGKSQAQEIIIEIDPSASSGGAIEGKNGEKITARTVIFYDPTGQNKAVTLKTYDSSTLIYAGGFKRSGYSLKGWNTQSNGKGTDFKNGEEYTFKTDETELDLYAMWTVNTNETIQGESGNGASQDIIDAYKKNGTLPDDWDPSSGSGGTIGNIPSNWKEIYSDRPYYDVDSGKYYYDAVIWAEQVGAITGILGIDSDLFNGELPCTRADLVTLLWEVAGEPEPKKSKAVFDDVKDGMYYSKAVCWANEQGIILGIGGNKMDPDGIVTRSQAMTVLWRYHGSPAPSGNTSFKDVVKGSWYEKAVLWGYEKQITLGTSATTFSPDVKCSRGETVTFLFRDIVGISQ